MLKDQGLISLQGTIKLLKTEVKCPSKKGKEKGGEGGGWVGGRKTPRRNEKKAKSPGEKCGRRGLKRRNSHHLPQHFWGFKKNREKGGPPPPVPT